MKSLYKLVIYLIFISFCLFSNGQSSKNHSLGFQLNPYLDTYLFHGISIKPVYAARYNFFILKDHLQFGPEFSGFFEKGLSSNKGIWVSNINIGAYVRINILSKSRFNPFFEYSPYCTFLNSKPASTNDIYLSNYFAPGISLHTKSRKLSLDLLFKYSNTDKWPVTGSKGLPSYRVNINF